MSAPRRFYKDQTPPEVYGIPIVSLPGGWLGGIATVAKSAEVLLMLMVTQERRGELRAQFSRDMRVVVTNSFGWTVFYATTEGDMADAAYLFVEYTEKLKQLGFGP